MDIGVCPLSVNTAAVNMTVQVLWGHMFSAFLVMYVAGSCGNFAFSILSHCQAVFRSGCTILQFHQQCIRVPNSPRPCQYLELGILFILIILMGVKWHLVVVYSVFMSLIANDVKLSLFSLVINVSLLERCLFESWTHFVIGLFIFSLRSRKSTYFADEQQVFYTPQRHQNALMDL